VEYVQHFEERHVRVDAVERIGRDVAGIRAVLLAPDVEGEFHERGLSWWNRHSCLCGSARHRQEFLCYQGSQAIASSHFLTLPASMAPSRFPPAQADARTAYQSGFTPFSCLTCSGRKEPPIADFMPPRPTLST